MAIARTQEPARCCRIQRSDSASRVDAPQDNGFQFTDAELAKLEDPRVKASFLVNPGNPTSVAINPAVRTSIANLVRARRPDLMLITDDVYATFVDDFRSLMGELPRNAIGVYSYSKFFGCTGWRLGVTAIHEDNLCDTKIAALPETERQVFDHRYGMLALEPRRSASSIGSWPTAVTSR